MIRLVLECVRQKKRVLFTEQFPRQAQACRLAFRIKAVGKADLGMAGEVGRAERASDKKIDLGKNRVKFFHQAVAGAVGLDVLDGRNKPV